MVQNSLNGRRVRDLCSPILVGVIVILGVALGCGGGGGGSSTGTNPTRPPFAAPPTCSAAVVTSKQMVRPIPGGGSPSIMVPTSSIEQPGDVGIRVHTNHLIYSPSTHPMVALPQGLNPQQVGGAYGLAAPNSAGSGAIAIVDAYNYPTALADFNAFSSTFGLPTETSSNVLSSSNGALQVVYATGAKPANDGSWSQEMAIDIEWAHAMAPYAKIYLVEAASSNLADIAAAVNVAKALPGVREVSTSFGGTETGCTYVHYNSTFAQPGVVFFAAAGDVAGEHVFPALSQNVVAVGGTSLTVSPTGTWLAESVWNGTGCGPSAFEPRPIYQDTYYSQIGLYRAGCDIAAVADPNTGVAVYDSYSYQGVSGWFIAGGTSVSTPIIAGIANGINTNFANSQAFNTALYANAGSASFHAITSGSSGGYNAGTPWSFPTGLGSPNGLARLASPSTPNRNRRP